MYSVKENIQKTNFKKVINLICHQQQGTVVATGEQQQCKQQQGEGEGGGGALPVPLPPRRPSIDNLANCSEPQERGKKKEEKAVHAVSAFSIYFY